VQRLVVWSVLAAIASAGLAYAVRRPLLSAIGGFLIVADDRQPADAIVVLSGSLPDRILEAIDLYQAHLAPRIILTRGVSLPGLEALRARGGAVLEPHEQNLDVARQLGVPPEVMAVMPAPISSTLGEARALLRYLQEQGIRSILLVTSKPHARRAGMIFSAVAGGRVRIAVCPSRYDPFTAETWWHYRARTRRLVTEYGKLLTYLLIDRWRVACVG
jgi:uncharacterized SAM-binding protein YcdF (DUF218 family)